MQVWKNLHTAWVSEEIASTWHIVVRDIVPTNERLHVIRRVESDRCRHCGRRDTLVHRLTECNEGTANLVVDKGKNCADASNGPAPHARRLVSTAPFQILATTAT